MFLPLMLVALQSAGAPRAPGQVVGPPVPKHLKLPGATVWIIADALPDIPLAKEDAAQGWGMSRRAMSRWFKDPNGAWKRPPLEPPAPVLMTGPRFGGNVVTSAPLNLRFWEWF